MTPQILEEQLKTLPTLSFAAGETLMAAGTTTGRLIFLQEGELAVVREGVVVTRIREPGAVFGEMSLLLGGPHTADVVATRPSRCQVVEDAAAMLTASPELAAYVARVLAHRLDAVTRYLVDVKRQFAEADGHLGMVEEVLETVMNRHPRGMRARSP